MNSYASQGDADTAVDDVQEMFCSPCGMQGSISQTEIGQSRPLCQGFSDGMSVVSVVLMHCEGTIGTATMA